MHYPAGCATITIGTTLTTTWGLANAERNAEDYRLLAHARASLPCRTVTNVLTKASSADPQYSRRIDNSMLQNWKEQWLRLTRALFTTPSVRTEAELVGVADKMYFEIRQSRQSAEASIRRAVCKGQ